MRQQLEALWRAHREELKAFIMRRVSSPATADDILQDVFCKTLSCLEDGRLEHPRGWLFSVARNAVADHYRGRRLTVELPPTLVAACPGPGDVPPREMGACLMPMIAALPEKMRAPLVLADYEGMRQREVASRLGISLAAVKSRVLRARLQLRRMIEDCCQLERDAQGRIMDFDVKPGGCSPWTVARTGG